MPSEHVVREGDGLSKIALKHGFFAETIWNHALNAELKQKRQSPEILLPGDIVRIPDKQIKEVTGASDQRHRFRRKGTPTRFQIRLMSGNTPRADEPYLIEIDGQRTLSGKTDADGWIRVFLTPNAATGKLMLAQGSETYRLQFGHVDPIDSASGAQSRLWNLGFYTGAIDGTWNQELATAISAFQRLAGLDETGQMDQSTQTALTQAFGS